MAQSERGVLTIAYGASKYLRMARALALSIRHYQTREKLAVVTDTPEYFEGLYDHLIPLELHYGSGVVQKLHLDRYSPFDETLFIDSDCLLYGPTDALWTFFGRDRNFGVRSVEQLTHGDSCQGVRDFDRYLDYFGLERIPNIKGGVYYFDDSKAAAEVFSTAREILGRREAAGLTAFKNAPVADEVVFATAQTLCGTDPICREHETTPVNTFLGRTDPVEINVLKGSSTFVKNGILRQPTLIHYPIGTQRGYYYLRDINRLELHDAPAAELRARVWAASEYVRYWGRQKIENTQRRVRKMGPIGLLPGRVLRRLGIGDLKPL